MIDIKQNTKFILVLGVSLVIVFSCKENDKQQKVEKFSIDRLDAFSMVYDYPINDSTVHKTKMEIYLVTGYEDTEAIANAIDSFTCANISSDYNKYDSYYIGFYKKSKVTTIENLAINPNVWDNYSIGHDLIYDYTWRDGRFSGSNKWEKDNPISYRYKIPCLKSSSYD